MAVLAQIDHFLQQWVAGFQNVFFDMIAIFLNWFGNDIRVYGIFLLFFFIPKKTRRFAILAFISVITATLLVTYIKVTVDRPRPFVTHHLIPIIHVDASEYYVSFPSGHTTAIASMVGAYYFYFKRHLVVGIGLILLMSWSRMYLNMHYPLDTLAGGVIGIVIAWSVVQINTYYRAYRLK